MMVSTGRQVRVRVQPTADRKKIKDAASGLFLDGGGTPLMDGLMEIDDRFMRKAEDRWPVFVIITSDGSESSAGANEKKFNDWLAVLPVRGFSAHAISIKYRGGGMPEIVAQHVAATAGGSYDYINTSNSLPEKMTAIAQRLSSDYEHAKSRYQITYLTDAADVRPVDVGVARDGVHLEISGARVH
jgi:Mg-chelatase subunit ChlD